MLELAHKNKKIIIGGISLIVISAATTWLASNDYLTLEALQQSLGFLEEHYDENPTLFISLYMVIYVVTVALFLPGLFLLNLLAGAILGPLWGIVIASLSAAAGSLTGFFTSRYVFSDWVKETFPQKSKSLNKVMKKNSWITVMLLRLTPALPVGLTNLLMGITKVNTRVFFIATLVGVVPWIAFYVIAGVELASIDKASDIVSLETSLLALALIVLIAGGRYLMSKLSPPS